MTFSIHPEQLQQKLIQVLGSQVSEVSVALNEVTVKVSSINYLSVMQALRDSPVCRFEQLIDLCGMDYSTYADVGTVGPRFGVVVHLLSVSLNQRVRVMAYGIQPTGTSAKRLTCMALCLRGTKICVASLPIMVSLVILSGKISQSLAMSKCVMTLSARA
jgi:hypothetical protein